MPRAAVKTKPKAVKGVTARVSQQLKAAVQALKPSKPLKLKKRKKLPSKSQRQKAKRKPMTFQGLVGVAYKEKIRLKDLEYKHLGEFYIKMKNKGLLNKRTLFEAEKDRLMTKKKYSKRKAEKQALKTVKNIFGG